MSYIEAKKSIGWNLSVPFPEKNNCFNRTLCRDIWATEKSHWFTLSVTLAILEYYAIAYSGSKIEIFLKKSSRYSSLWLVNSVFTIFFVFSMAGGKFERSTIRIGCCWKFKIGFPCIFWFWKIYLWLCISNVTSRACWKTRIDLDSEWFV